SHVPQDHVLRAIDRFVTLGDLRHQLAPFYSETGRPSIDPELMIGCLSSATASASDRNGACARRCTSISHIGGSGLQSSADSLHITFSFSYAFISHKNPEWLRHDRLSKAL